MKNDKYLTQNHVIQCLEGLKDEFNARIDTAIAIQRKLDKLNNHKDPDTTHAAITNWLINTRGIKTKARFYEWLRNSDPSAITAACYKHTYKRVSLDRIVDVAEEELSDIPITEVK